MFEYLRASTGPVISGLEDFEIVMGELQPEYQPLRCLPGNDGERMSRWTLTPSQREAIANGADIFVELLTYNQPMNPIRIAISDNPNPDFFREGYKLAVEVQER